MPLPIAELSSDLWYVLYWSTQQFLSSVSGSHFVFVCGFIMLEVGHHSSRQVLGLCLGHLLWKHWLKSKIEKKKEICK